MFTTRCTSKTARAQVSDSATRYSLILGASIAVASAALLTACGQKGNLYLVDSGSQAVKDSTAILDTGSNPQDTAFAKIDGNQDNNVQNNDQNTARFQLPEPSSDPNDY